MTHDPLAFLCLAVPVGLSLVALVVSVTSVVRSRRV